jgi:delta 1-pyrroline-5-carboxylate dehydrogenase
MTMPETSHSGDAMLSPVLLPGPSGERNSYSIMPRHGTVLVCHPDAQTRGRLSQIARDHGNSVQEVTAIPDHDNFDVVITHVDHHVDLAALRKALHRSSQRVIPFITDQGGHVWLQQEKHICRDMTASGGNIDLLMR